MATNYLKKTKLAFILGDIFNITIKPRSASYRFYRGTEWLNYSNDDFMYEICVRNGGRYLRVSKFHYDSNDNLYTDYSSLLNGYGRCEYVLPVKAGVCSEK